MNTLKQMLEGFIRTKGEDRIASYGGAVIASAAAIIGSPIAGLGAAIALTSFVTYVNKLQYNFYMDRLLNFSCDQIAAVKGEKDPRNINREDMINFAQGQGEFARFGPNPLLQEEIKNARRQYVISVGSHLVAAAVFAVAAFALAPLVSTVVASIGVGAGALLLYGDIDNLVHDASKTLFSRNRTRTLDDIRKLEEHLHRGHNVVPLEVYSILAKALPVERQRIEKEYGKGYDDLYRWQKNQAMHHFARRVNLRGMINQLNAGTMEGSDIFLMIGPKPPYKDLQVRKNLQAFHAQRLSNITPTVQELPQPDNEVNTTEPQGRDSNHYSHRHNDKQILGKNTAKILRQRESAPEHLEPTRH